MHQVPWLLSAHVQAPQAVGNRRNVDKVSPPALLNFMALYSPVIMPGRHYNTSYPGRIWGCCTLPLPRLTIKHPICWNHGAALYLTSSVQFKMYFRSRAHASRRTLVGFSTFPHTWIHVYRFLYSSWRAAHDHLRGLKLKTIVYKTGPPSCHSCPFRWQKGLEM